MGISRSRISALRKKSLILHGLSAEPPIILLRRLLPLKVITSLLIGKCCYESTNYDPLTCLRWSLGILIFEMLCGFTPFWDQGSPVKIYQNILQGRVKFPPYLHPDAVDLLSRLITADLTKRLGNLHAGSEDIKNHPWFAEVTWERLLRKEIDAPYVPPIRGGQGDASQYENYQEETEAYGHDGDDP